MTDCVTWPPEVAIKKHPRARHVKLKASLQHGLELVVPPRFKEKEIPFILEQNRAWIEKQLRALAEKKLVSVALPVEINLLAVNENWKVSYVLTDGSFIRIIPRPHHDLALAGDINNKSLCRKALLTWLKHRAKISLLPKLQSLSQQLQLPYNKANIRYQQTRWGSCSADKIINLNCTLLFLPEALATHVLIHELCHLKYLNHSSKFWNLVKSFDCNFEENRRILKKSNSFVPSWLSEPLV